MDTKTPSSEPSPQRRSARKKTKEPSSESKEEEELREETRSFGRDAEAWEEDEPATPLLEKNKRMDNRASDKKKPALAFKIPVAPKQPIKSTRKGKSSLKKPRGK